MKGLHMRTLAFLAILLIGGAGLCWAAASQGPRSDSEPSSQPATAPAEDTGDQAKPEPKPRSATTQAGAVKNKNKDKNKVPKADVPEAQSDTSKVFVIVEGPSYVERIARPVEQAMTRYRRGGPQPLGGLKVILGSNPGTGAADATAAKAGAMLHIKVTNRTVQFLGQLEFYKLAAVCTLYVANGNGWKQVYSGKLSTSGSEGGLASSAPISDADHLVDVLAPIVVSRLFPCKAAFNKGALEVTIKNTSPLTIRRLTLAIPTNEKEGAFSTVSSDPTSIGSGEEKVVTFGRSRASDMQKAVVGGIEFERPAKNAAATADAAARFKFVVAEARKLNLPDNKMVLLAKIEKEIQAAKAYANGIDKIASAVLSPAQMQTILKMYEEGPAGSDPGSGSRRK